MPRILRADYVVIMRHDTIPSANLFTLLPTIVATTFTGYQVPRGNGAATIDWLTTSSALRYSVFLSTKSNIAETEVSATG